MRRRRDCDMLLPLVFWAPLAFLSRISQLISFVARGLSHTVWFQPARSAKEKIDAQNSAGVAHGAIALKKSVGSKFGCEQLIFINGKYINADLLSVRALCEKMFFIMRTPPEGRSDPPVRTYC